MDLLKLIHKELRAEILNKEIIITMLSFGLSIIVIISFTSNLSKQIIEAYAPGLFWLMILFVTVLGVHRSYAYEKEFNAIDLILSAPIDRGLIFIAKALSGFIFITLMQALIVFPYFTFLSIDIDVNFFPLILSTLLINLTLMFVSNLISGISMRARISEILFPVLLFPLISPLIIAATNITNSIINQAPYTEWQVWIYLLISILIVFGLSGYALFDFILEE